MLTPDYIHVVYSLVLVLVAIGVTLWWRIPVAREITLGPVRAFVQLVAVGYALTFLFEPGRSWMIIPVLLVMTTVGAYAAAGRVKKLKGAYAVTFSSILIGSAITLGLMLALPIIDFEARVVIPLSGMIISNAMNASAITINRFAADMRSHRLAVETSLSLGKSWRDASRPFQREAIMAGMISILNFMKTVGIVALPGAMTGMILGGAEPLDAALLQLIVAFMLLSAMSITSALTVEFTVRRFFTSLDQLRHDV